MPTHHEFVSVVKDQFSKEGQDLLFEFFVTFSRFECALKSTVHFAKPQAGKAEPDWDRFEASIRNQFDADTSKELRDAVDYILSQPPRMQTLHLNDGHEFQLSWTDRAIDANTPLTKKLNLHIRDIRNNLFHGGKFQGSLHKELSRNYKLLTSALMILDEWLRLSPQVSTAFFEPIPSS